MSTNQLKYIVLAGLFAIPFIPLVVTKSLFFPFITGKAFVFRFIIEIIFAVWIVLAIRDVEYRPKFSWILGSVLFFLVAIGIADILSENPLKSFWSNFERMEGFISLLHFGALFLVSGTMLRTQKIWNKLLSTSLVASAVMALYSFFQIAGKVTINQGGVRVDGTFGNASYLGIYMVFHIFFATLLFFRLEERWKKVAVLLIGLADLVVLYFTATRGAILGLLGGAFITLLFLAIKSEKGDKIRKVALGIVGALVLFVGLFISIRNTSFVQTSPVLGRFASLSVNEIKTQGRYYVWPIAFKGFLERPVFGWGQESFNFVFNKYYDSRMYSQEPWFDRTHNIILDWLVAGGLLGLLSYTGIFISVLVYIFKAKSDVLSKEDKAVILGLLGAYLFHNLFVFDQIGSYILFFTLLAYIHSHTPETQNSVWKKMSQWFSDTTKKESHRPVYESATLIILLVVLYFVNYVPLKLNMDLLEVLKVQSSGQVGTLDTYVKPLKKNTLGFPEAIEHISQASIFMSSNPEVSAELNSDLFKQLDQSFKVQLEQIPNDARYRLFYGVYLSRFGSYDGALEQLEEARKLSPNKQTIYFEIISNLLIQGKKAEALALAKTAYELEPNFKGAQMVYGFTALASGDDSLSNQILANINENEIIFDDRYVTILLSLGRTSEIINVAKRRIELDPANLQHRITLTAAYLQAGRRTEAVNTIQEIISLDPSFKERGEYYIKEIQAGRNP